MKLEFTPPAAPDLREAHDWYANRGVEGLERQFEEAVQATLDLILEQPRLYRKLRGPVRRALMRRFPYGVYYLLEADSVVVLGVRHFARKPVDWET